MQMVDQSSYENSFFKLWRNKIIRNRIFYHLNIFNSHIYSREYTIHQINRYQWKEYTQNIVLVDEEFYQNKLPKLPVNIVKLSFKNLNKEINKDWWTVNRNITTLDLGRMYTHPLKSGDIPDTITTLLLGDKYNHPLKLGDIPDSVTSLIFSNRWDQVVSNLPKNLKNLRFGNDFNNLDQPLNLDEFPSTIECIRFGTKFQKEFVFNPTTAVNQLPSLTKLEFNSYYKQPITTSTIPSTVKELFLGYNGLSTSLPNGCIPNSVTKLSLGDNLSGTITSNLIPSSVTDLSLGNNNEIASNQSIPNSITRLDMGLYYNRELKDGSIPANVKTLKFSHDYNQPITSINLLPHGLTSLDLGNYYHAMKIKNVLPSTLLELKFNRLFNADSLGDNVLPDSITSLQIRPNFKYNNIPSSLTKLVWINFTEQIPKDYLTHSSFNNLKILDTSESCYNKQILPGSLPIGLEELKLGFDWNQDLSASMLPPNLLSLQLGESFSRSIPSDTLPNSLKTLTVLGFPKLTIDSLPENLNSLFCYNTNSNFLNSLDFYYFWCVLKIKKFYW